MTPKKAAVQRSFRVLAQGLRRSFGEDATLVVAGTTYRVAELLTVFDTMVNLSMAVERALAAYRVALQKEREQLEKAEPLRLAIKRVVVAQMGPNPVKLHPFGFEVPRTAKKSIAVRAEAVKKGKATRAARGTMGKKQRRKVKGTG